MKLDITEEEAQAIITSLLLAKEDSGLSYNSFVDFLSKLSTALPKKTQNVFEPILVSLVDLKEQEELH